MNCTKVRRLLPLLIGLDLPSSKEQKVLSHLQDCQRCALEFSMLKQSLKKTTDWLAIDSVKWKESDWAGIIQKALPQEEKKILAPWPFKKGWAWALMATTAIFLSIFVAHPSLIKNKLGETTAKQRETSPPEVLSMKIVSKETGLKINWFFHKDLKLEVMK